MFSLKDKEEGMVDRLMVFFFQAEDGIRDLVRSRGLGDVYKRQLHDHKICIIGNGVVFDPKVFLQELKELNEGGLFPLSLIHI